MRPRIFALLMILVLAGCVSTPAGRIAGNRAAFDSWPAAVQAQVRAGTVAPGFTADQVRMAVGEPDHVYTRTTAAGTDEVWGYRSHQPRFSVGIGVAGGGGSTRVGGGTVLSSGGPYDDEVMRVIFSGGRVGAIEKTR
jgi:hypothetical protein